ncbi:MAG: zf-HC2 domain-containing protein [Lachnospiraceae bacterium]|nr:zf-HC2 domain-containing protein [Lachnospiraceae bacterium]
MKQKKEKLTCMQVEHSIKEYLLNEMTLEQADAFVRHVRQCKECRKELEEYYAFSSALMQLETMDDTEKGDFFLNVEKRLERTENTVLKTKKDHRRRVWSYGLIVLFIAMAMGVGFGI